MMGIELCWSCVVKFNIAALSTRYQALLQWQKNNPGATFNDLAEAFHKAGRQDMVELTYQVAEESRYTPPPIPNPVQAVVRALACSNCYCSKFVY